MRGEYYWSHFYWTLCMLIDYKCSVDSAWEPCSLVHESLLNSSGLSWHPFYRHRQQWAIINDSFQLNCHLNRITRTHLLESFSQHEHKTIGLLDCAAAARHHTVTKWYSQSAYHDNFISYIRFLHFFQFRLLSFFSSLCLFLSSQSVSTRAPTMIYIHC